MYNVLCSAYVSLATVLLRTRGLLVSRDEVRVCCLRELAGREDGERWEDHQRM